MDAVPAMSFTDELKAHLQPIRSEDTMAEAGRKALLPDFIDMLNHEAGSRTGEDIEDVHDMRVATRRMRSVLQLLSEYFKPKLVREYTMSLRKIAGALGTVRDLDVLILDLEKFQGTLDEDGKSGIQGVIERLNGERAYARHQLTRLLDKGMYRRFIDAYGKFLITSGVGVKTVDADDLAPSQLRHLLPILIYEHLGTVRAYDSRIAEADAETLHALRIEFKRLRYLVSLFSSVMGSSIKDFITELKAIQDHLGRLNDLHVAQERMQGLVKELSETEAAALNAYVETLHAEEAKLREEVVDVWKHFNGKTVQRQLATAIAAL